MRPELPRSLKILLLFLLLFVLRAPLAQGYLLLLQPVADILLGGSAGYQLSDGSALRLVTFLTLVFATRSASLGCRLRILLAGLIVFVVIDLAGWFLWPQARPFHAPSGGTLLQQFFGLVWVALRDLLFPLLLWLVASDRHQASGWPAPTALYEMDSRDPLSEG